MDDDELMTNEVIVSSTAWSSICENLP